MCSVLPSTFFCLFCSTLNEKNKLFSLLFSLEGMLKETRNQRRTRRRAETAEDRYNARKEIYVQNAKNLPVIVFRYWEFNCITGYVYGSLRFSNGTLIRSGDVRHEENKVGMHVIFTLNSKYRVVQMNDNWRQVGAGHVLNRLKYKLWPKLVLIALYHKTVRKLFEPGGIGYHECLKRFEEMSMTM